MDEWGSEALELKAWMVTLGTMIGEKSDTHKLIRELDGLFNVQMQNLSIYCRINDRRPKVFFLFMTQMHSKFINKN